MTDERREGGLGLDAWLALVARTLDEPAPVVGREERGLLLDLARVAARRSERIAAPITTYILGESLASIPADQRAARLRRVLAELESVAD